MAVTKEDLLIQIKADSAKAVQGLESVTAVLGSMERQLKTATVAQQKSAASLSDFGAIAAKAAGFIYVAKTAAEALASGFQKTVGEYYKSEDGLRRLSNALALVGEQNIPQSLAMFQSLAQQIQETTTVEDDQVIALAALGVAAGRTDQEVRKLITAAVDIAAVTGTSVDTAFKQLLETFKGTAGALEYLAPQLKNLTAQQLAAGDGVDLMAAKFAGAGAGLAGTFSGQVQQAKNALGDLAEETGKVLAKAFNIDQVSVGFNKAIQTMTDFLAENGAAIAATLAGIKQAFLNFVSSIGVAILGLTEGMLTPLAKSLGIGTGLVEKLARANQALRDSMISSQAASEKAFASYQKQVQATVATTEKSRRAPTAVASPEGKNLLKELEAKVREMQKAAQLANKTELEQISIRADLQRYELKILEDKLKKERALTDEAQRRLEIGRQAINEQEAEDKKKLERSLDVALGQVVQSGDTERNAIRQQFADMQKLIDMKREFLFMKGPPPEAAVRELDDQQRILENRRQAATAAVPSNVFEEAKSSGEVIAGEITGALTGPGLGAITGAMSGALAVVSAAQAAIDMAQQLVDALPRFLDAVANLFASLTDLPNRLAQSIGQVFTQFTAFVRNFLPNLVRMMASVLDSLTSFVENLPDAFMAMVDELDTLLTNFIEKLPAIAERLATALVEAGPEISVKMMEVMLSKAPELAFRLIKVMATRLPVAIYDGIIKGLLKVREMLANLFKGRWPKAMTPPAIQVDGKQASKVIAQLTKDVNKLFSVNALEDAAQAAQDPVAAVNEAAKKAGKSMWEAFKNAMQEAWDWLKRAGAHIWNGLLEAVGDVAKTLGRWGTAIWDGLVKTVGDIGRTFGRWGTALWQGVTQAVGELGQTFGAWGAALWQGTLAAVGELGATFGSWGTALWDGTLAAVGELGATFGSWGAALWQGVTGSIGDLGSAFGAWGAALWQGVTGSIGDPAQAFGGWGRQIWAGVSGAVGDLANTFGSWGRAIWAGFANLVGDTFGGFGRQIAASLQAGVSSLGSYVSNLFQAIGKTFAGLFKLDASGAAKGIQEAFVVGSNILRDAFHGVINPIVDVFNGLIDALNGIKIPAIEYGGSIMGKKFGGTLIPETDLIPGEIAKIARFAQGGLVQGPGGTDQVPAMLTAGEFVISRPAVEAIGLPTLRALNGGQGSTGSVTQHITFNLKIESKEKVDEQFIKQRLMPAIREELKRGSLDGRAVVYAGGVRA